MALVLLLLAGCGQSPPPAAAPARPAAAPTVGAGPATAGTAGALAPPPAPAAATPVLPPHRKARDWDDWKRQAALRLVAANPGRTYDGPVPEPLLAIPVLELELNGDGSLRRVTVLRRPGQALDTVQLAMDAVHRAAPFAPVAHLPRPWKSAEVFLFNDQRRFKPRTLDD
ncbi:MAG: hypothetical protein KBC73_13100 [Burkholderiaceae bacterium]|nr:hypothetical protein [Burkholderiaceae bacterium]